MCPLNNVYRDFVTRFSASVFFSSNNSMWAPDRLKVGFEFAEIVDYKFANIAVSGDNDTTEPTLSGVNGTADR
jgi:hypothetical protein